MNAHRATPKSRRAVLPVLALLLGAAVATAASALLAFQDLEETCVQSELTRRTASVRARAFRARAGARRLGELVAAPKTSADVRAMVAFCDTATSRDAASLREVALRSDDALAAANAIRALGRIGAVVRDPELLALLDDPRQRVRDETILALGESRDDEAIDVLAPLTRSSDPKVRLVALRAIGRLGGKRARSVARDLAASSVATREERAFALAAFAAAESR